MSQCPNCSTKDAYLGIFGWSCTSEGCEYYTPPATNKTVNKKTKIDKKGKSIFHMDTVEVSNIKFFEPKITALNLSYFSKEIKFQIDLAKKIMSSLTKMGCSSIIAGGAPRNWNKGIKAKDLDIFTTRDWLGDPQRQNILPKTMKPLNKIYNNTKKNFARSVHEFEKNGEKIQLITVDYFNKDVKDLNSFINQIFLTFDWSICKIAMQPNGSFYESVEYQKDIANKKLTLNITNVEKYNRVSNVAERFRKMKTLYPDHEAVIV